MSVANDCFPILMSDGVEVIEIWWWKDKRHWTDDDVVDGLRGGWGGGRWNVGRKVSKHATWRGNGVVWMDNRRRHLLLNWSIEFPPKEMFEESQHLTSQLAAIAVKSGYEPQRVPWSWRAASLDRRSINLHTWLIGCMLPGPCLCFYHKTAFYRHSPVWPWIKPKFAQLWLFPGQFANSQLNALIGRLQFLQRTALTRILLASCSWWDVT